MLEDQATQWEKEQWWIVYCRERKWNYQKIKSYRNTVKESLKFDGVGKNRLSV